jgi:hypothetical protein
MNLAILLFLEELKGKHYVGKEDLGVDWVRVREGSPQSRNGAKQP